MAFRYSFELNGVELKDISIGSTVIDKLEEPLDEGAFKLAFTTREIEYRMLGYLKIRVKDYNDIDDNNVIEFEYIVISDEVSEGSKYGDFIHDLVVVEYTHKYDKYLVHSLAKTKALKNENPAKFKYNRVINANNENVVRVWVETVDILETYYVDEPITFKQVEKGIQATFEYDASQPYLLYQYNNLIETYIKVDGIRYTISSQDVTFEFISVGDKEIEYGFKSVYNDYGVPENEDVWLYKYYVRVIPKEVLSVYDILDMVRTNISKFGGIESKLNFDRTRLFTIDPIIAEKLKQVEVPQTYIQKATLRQVLNSIFLYVNSISRVKRDETRNIDILTMDEFNEVVGSFEMKDISAYNSSQDSQELSSKGVSWLERVLPDNRERPNVIDPSANGYKTVRSTNIQIVRDKFGLELSRPMYEPKKFTFTVEGLVVNGNIPPITTLSQTYENYVVDLTARFISKEEWSLKVIDTDFPTIKTQNLYAENVGMREKRVANIYWTPNTTYIDLSDIYGKVWQETLIQNVIREALNEQLTRKPIKPFFYEIDNVEYMVTSQSYAFNGMSDGLYKTNVVFNNIDWQYYRFNLEYITQEDVTVETERDDLTYLDFYSESRLNQSDKLINVSLASRKNYGDMQRSGLPNKTFQKIHTNISSIYTVGLQDINGFVITTRKLQFYNDYILATYSATKDHNRLSQYIGLQQSYRAFEIPTSSQIFERIETYSDFVYILNPNDILEEEFTFIHSDNTMKLLLGNLVNNWVNEITNGITRVTVGFVRTNAFVERYDDGVYYHAIATPVNAFGKKGGLVFQFGFENNQLALNAVETLLPIGNISFLAQRYNKAIKYTDNFGKIDELWFMLASSMTMGVGSDWNDVEVVDNYPLVRDNQPNDAQVFGAKTILFRSGDMRLENEDYNPLIVTKDSSQNIKIPYHLQVLAKEVDEYVIGDAFYTENFLVKNPNVVKSQIVGTKMYVYIYNNHTNYGKFDDLLVKDEYNIVEELVLDTNVVINYANRTFRFIGSLATQIANGSNWAIGDEFENLYMACNFNYNGFNFYQRHFREGLIEIGKLPITPFVNVSVNSIIEDFYLTTDTLSEIETLFVSGYDDTVIYISNLMANILMDGNINVADIEHDEISETINVFIDNFSQVISYINDLRTSIETLDYANDSFIDNDTLIETTVLTSDLATIIKTTVSLYQSITITDNLLYGYLENDYLLEQATLSVAPTVAKVTQFTVTFNANGGTTPSPTSKIVTYGTPYGVLATTTKSGYNFVGWNTTIASGGTYINPNTTVTLTANQTLYARWSITPVEWVSGGTSPSGGSSCSILGDAGNIVCDVSCSFVPKGSYYSTVDISNNPNCGEGVRKYVCTKQSPTSWLCNIYEGEVTYTNCKTCVVK